MPYQDEFFSNRPFGCDFKIVLNDPGCFHSGLHYVLVSWYVLGK